MANKKSLLKKTMTLPWTLIIAALIFALPLGMIFWYQKIVSNRVDSDKNCKIAQKIYCGFYLFGLLIFLSGFPDNLLLLIAAGVYIVMGVVQMRIVARVWVNSRKYAKYIELVERKKIYSIDEIAKRSGKPFDITVVDLLNLQDNGYLPDTYLDVQARELVSKENRMKKKSNESVAVICKKCGAIGAITPNKIGKCVYCNSFLEYNWI